MTSDAERILAPLVILRHGYRLSRAVARGASRVYFCGMRCPGRYHSYHLLSSNMASATDISCAPLMARSNRDNAIRVMTLQTGSSFGGMRHFRYPRRQYRFQHSMAEKALPIGIAFVTQGGWSKTTGRMAGLADLTLGHMRYVGDRARYGAGALLNISY